MVGRAEQRARLRRALDDVVADGSRFVIVGGEAGAGKTTVIEAFVDDLFGSLADRHAQLIRGQCVPMGGDGLPYAPIVGALRDLVGLHGREQVLEWAGVGRSALGALLPDLAPPPVEGDAVRLQLFEAITLLWERASVKGPLVVVIEDIHWADESTRHLLRFLARALTDAPVLIVASYRTDELTRRHPLRPFLAEVGRFSGTVRVEVPNLDRAEVAELLTRLLDHPPSNPVVEAIYRRSEGIPYFVEELTRSASRGCIDMPDTLRDALNVRVQALSDQTQEILQLAAVAGNRVDHDLLEAVAEVASHELEGALREAVDAAVLVADESGYLFRHALLREVIHDDLLPGQHARMHARFAALLETRPELVRQGTAPLEIAHHWSAAHETNKAFQWSITATRTPSLAYNETLKMYERALELWDQVAEPESLAGPHAAVLLRSAKVAEDAGETERSLALVTAALDESDPDCEPEDRIEALILKARLLFSLIRPGTLEPLREALAILPDDADPRLRARVLEELARRLMLSGSMAEGNETARLAIAAALDAGSASVEANARTTLATGLLALGVEDEGLAEFEKACNLTRDNTRTALRYYINYSDGLQVAGRYTDALEQALRGVQVARDLGLERSLGAMLAGNAAEPLIAIGEWDRASSMISRALELEPPMHHQAHLRLLQAWLSVWRGELDVADATLLDFRPMIGGEQPSPQYASFAIRTDAEHALAAGDLARAWFDVEVFLDQPEIYNRSFAYEMLGSGRLWRARSTSRKASSGGRLWSVSSTSTAPARSPSAGCGGR